MNEMRFYIGTEKVEYNGKRLFLTTSVNDSDLDCMKPFLECISGLEIWKDDDLVELTSFIESKSGLLPMDVVFLTNFCEYVQTHEDCVDTMEIAILDFRLILAKFDSFNSLFVERQQLDEFIKALSTNSKGRYINRKRKTECY